MVESPEVVPVEAESLAGLDVHDPSLDRLRHELLNLAASGSSLEKAGVQAHFTRKGMADLLASSTLPFTDPVFVCAWLKMDKVVSTKTVSRVVIFLIL
jgi:hypothetical protein